MTTTMAAWQWTGTGNPLSRHDVPVPVPGDGEVLLAVRAAGMCHSDVGELDEPSWAVNIARNPITLGHEIAGEVVAVGRDVTAWQVGDRVGVHPLGATVPGYSRDGGYAAFHVAPAADLVRIPDSLGYDMAALGTDAGMTSHHAVVEVARVRKGSRVGIIGLGGLGQIGAQVAVLLGAEVYGADPNPDARAAAAGWGLAGLYATPEEMAGLDLDAAVDFAGFGTTTEAALHAIRKGGDVVMIGLGAEHTTLTTADVIHQKAHIHGSSGGTRADIEAVYAYLDRGLVNPRVEHLGFEEVPTGIERLRAGRVTGRLVVWMD
jgi:propanol-preferring alcohol dehydrogenase